MTIHEGNKLNLKCKSRLKRANCSTLNGSSSIVSFDIVLSGDIEKKTGPGLSSKCTECNKTIDKS